MLQKVTVADQASGELVQVDVDGDRLTALMEWGRANQARLVGSASDWRSMGARTWTARDAAEALFFSVSQLAHVEQGFYEKYYRPMQYDQLCPLDFSAGEHVDSILYEVYDRVGNAQDADSAADDIPYSDTAVAQRTFSVVHGFAGYQFTQQELRTSAVLRRPLPERRLAAAMEMYQRKLNRVGLLGNTLKNLTGLLNNASVTSATRPSGKKWDGTDATPITAAQLISDFGYGMYQVWLNSGFNVIPDVVGVPAGAYQYMSTTPASATIPTITILSFLLQNNLCNQKNGKQLQIVPIYDADTAGAGSTGRAVFYDKSDQTLVMHIPMPLRFLAPQLEGVHVKVPGEFRYSGVEVRRITNMYYMDGVQ